MNISVAYLVETALPKETKRPSEAIIVDLTGTDNIVGMASSDNFIDLTVVDSVENHKRSTSMVGHCATDSIVDSDHDCKRRKGTTSECADSNVDKCQIREASAQNTNVATYDTLSVQKVVQTMDRIIARMKRSNGVLEAICYNLSVRNAKSCNLYAKYPLSHLQPPPHIVVPAGQSIDQAIINNLVAGLPGYPDPNLQDPPLPTSPKGIMTLTRAQLTAVENYYGLGHDGKVAERRERIKKCYGIGVR